MMSPSEDDEQFQMVLIDRFRRLYPYVEETVVAQTVRTEYLRFLGSLDRYFVHVFVEQSSKIVLSRLNVAHHDGATDTGPLTLD